MLTTGTDLTTAITDLMNGLMAFPNLVGLFALSGVVAKDLSIN